MASMAFSAPTALATWAMAVAVLCLAARNVHGYSGIACQFLSSYHLALFYPGIAWYRDLEHTVRPEGNPPLTAIMTATQVTDAGTGPWTPQRRAVSSGIT